MSALRDTSHHDFGASTAGTWFGRDRAAEHHGNQLAGSMDHRDAVAVLTILHKGGYQLDPAAVHAWVLAHGWPAGRAKRLREMCVKLSGGHSLRATGAAAVLRPDILQQWRQAAANR